MNKKIEILYKEKNKVDDGHFCLLNGFEKDGYCYCPERDFKNITTGCCQNLCSFYKDMDYNIEGFIDHIFWMNSAENIKRSTDVFKRIVKTIQGIEIEVKS